jgi:hypothetical protein
MDILKGSTPTIFVGSDTGVVATGYSVAKNGVPAAGTGVLTTLGVIGGAVGFAPGDTDTAGDLAVYLLDITGLLLLGVRYFRVVNSGPIPLIIE